MNLNEFRKNHPNLAIITISICISLWMVGLARMWEHFIPKKLPFTMLMCLSALLYLSLDDGNITEIFGVQAHEENKKRFHLSNEQVEQPLVNAGAVSSVGTRN
jgi:hypothetical protein